MLGGSKSQSSSSRIPGKGQNKQLMKADLIRETASDLSSEKSQSFDSPKHNKAGDVKDSVDSSIELVENVKQQKLFEKFIN